MPRDPKDIDATEKTVSPADISKQTPEEEAEAERKRKEAEAAAAAAAEATAAAAAEEAAKLKDGEKTEKNEALDAINDITVLAKNLRDIAKDRAVAKNEAMGEGKLDRTAVVKAAYADPCEHLSEDEFLALEKAVHAISPFLPNPYPTPGQKPPVDPRLRRDLKSQGDFADSEGTNKGTLSKKDADALVSFVDKTAPKILETLTALVEKAS